MRIIVYLILVTIILTIFPILPVAQASAASAFGDGLKQTAEETGHVKAGANKPFAQTIGTAIQIFLRFLGVIFLILMIYGGYIWMMARGNDQEVDKAKNIIRNAIIGLVVVLAAYAITSFLMSTIYSGAPETHYEW